MTEEHNIRTQIQLTRNGPSVHRLRPSLHFARHLPQHQVECLVLQQGTIEHQLSKPPSRYFFFHHSLSWDVGRARLVRSTPERAVRVRAPAGDIVLCSWAKHLTFTVPLSTLVYKWVPGNLMLRVNLRWTSIPPWGE